MATRPRQYSGRITLTASSTGTEGNVEFGFVSGETFLQNRGPGAVFFLFQSSQASSNSFELRSSETYLCNVPTAGVSLVTTSTGADMRILALGGIYV